MNFPRHSNTLNESDGPPRHSSRPLWMLRRSTFPEKKELGWARKKKRSPKSGLQSTKRLVWIPQEKEVVNPITYSHQINWDSVPCSIYLISSYVYHMLSCTHFSQMSCTSQCTIPFLWTSNPFEGAENRLSAVDYHGETTSLRFRRSHLLSGMFCNFSSFDCGLRQSHNVDISMYIYIEYTCA